jgi:hypothetical protein
VKNIECKCAKNVNVLLNSHTKEYKKQVTIIGSSQYARRGAGFGGDVISRNYVAITLTKLYRFYTGCIRE